MSQYQRALEATEEHLRALQANGVRFVNVQAETLLALQQPVPDFPAIVQAEKEAPKESLPNLNPNLNLNPVPVPPRQ